MPRKNFNTLSTKVRQDPRRAARIDEHKAAIHDSLGLSALRARREKTQTDVAQTTGVSQARVSTIERQDDLYLSTLSGYIRALGGTLEVRAVFDDETVDLLPHNNPEAA